MEAEVMEIIKEKSTKEGFNLNFDAKWRQSFKYHYYIKFETQEILDILSELLKEELEYTGDKYVDLGRLIFKAQSSGLICSKEKNKLRENIAKEM